MESTHASELFTSVIAKHSALIYKVCYMYADDSEHLKDLYQEVMANIWQGLPGFRAESGISTWVYRIAINTCVSFFRHHGRHSDAMRLDDAAYCVADTSDEHSHQLREMYEMIGRLGKIDKAVIILWLDGHSYDEIADVTGLTRSNVASRLHRTKQRLINDNI